MRVIRNSGQNVSPSDDGRLYNQAFEDGLFEATSITSLGGNLVSLGAMYGIICGRDFTAEAQSVNVLLPEDGTETGYIYIQYDTTTEDIITIESALAPFTPQYDDINTSGTICQMILAEYEANSVAVTDITSVYPIATTKPNNSLIGSMATIETSPATASHTVGSYILWNNQLYKVTSAISVGETLVVGTNIEATDVGSEISDLNSDLERVLLWENSNTSSQFATTTLQIPTVHNYSELVILLYDSTNSTQFFTTFRCFYFSGKTTPIILNQNGGLWRDLYMYYATLQISSCSKESGGNDNTRLIPWRIYGIK